MEKICIALLSQYPCTWIAVVNSLNHAFYVKFSDCSPDEILGRMRSAC